ncbi:exopolysaccharide biosynthesis polyprenyl glycosylphosphotransferase [Streptomyces sp. DSM 44915]|uniref:Exopolysaccharide biosynthesis polyprenyl glycosylphosphotransferase n=1 Tax=Streptomyces chisholmiae TaxID=3075540 RepID=A0ABU2JJY3_9ACTN|nr:exopolysaccharide biosynthesis polyprenyl glycosylphosphotransferase [Streptomyces sp. DSM 44915]MDT0264814.1 exopolysaccharide biosynthesis polyprenyl glycosylphosphotransferase [Streptomyces sp. DSM 44915]
MRRPQVPRRRALPPAGTARWYRPVALTSDALGAFVPVLTVYYLTAQPRPLAAATVATLGWLGLRAAHHRYRRGALGESRGLLASLHDWLLLLGLLAGLRAVTGERSEVSAAALGLLWAPLVTSLTSAALHRHLTGRRHRAEAVRRVLVVGEPDTVDLVTARLAAGTDHAYVTVGAVLLGPGELTSGAPPLARLPAAAPAHSPAVPDLVPAGTDGSVVLSAARQQCADLVLLVPGARLSGDRLRRLSWSVQDAGLALTVATGLTEVARHRVTVASAAGLNLLHVAPPPRRGAAVLWKSALDRVLAALALALLAPLLALLALAVRLDSAGPVLFRQTRIGHRGTPFTLWKFRTMVPDAARRRPALESANEHRASPLFKIRQDPRITRLGRLLRRTSLDELPQLVNVVRGEMALVGPRPPLPDEVARYSTVELRRLTVRPGLTGPWQVSGRSELSWDEGLALDLSYTDNWTLTGDLDVLARTVRAVVSGRGAY